LEAISSPALKCIFERLYTEQQQLNRSTREIAMTSKPYIISYNHFVLLCYFLSVSFVRSHSDAHESW